MTTSASTAIARLAWWERRRGERRLNGPWRRQWPALAADRTPFGDDGDGPIGIGSADTGLTILPERESLDLLRVAGIRVTAAVAAADGDAAVAAAATFGWPVAVKLDTTDTAHKSDIGGVALGLADAHAVRAAFETLTAAGRRAGATVRGVIVEPMVASGVELIVGFRRDPMFGPTVVVGSGGILAEILDDVAIRLAPIDRTIALAMLDELRSAPIVAGTRGRLPIDRDAVADLVVAVARFGMERPGIVEIDLNPVIASEHGAIAVDALVVTAEVRGA